jgi:hypothetical protein
MIFHQNTCKVIESKDGCDGGNAFIDIKSGQKECIWLNKIDDRPTTQDTCTGLSVPWILLSTPWVLFSAPWILLSAPWLLLSAPWVLPPALPWCRHGNHAGCTGRFF